MNLVQFVHQMLLVLWILCIRYPKLDTTSIATLMPYINVSRRILVLDPRISRVVKLSMINNAPLDMLVTSVAHVPKAITDWIIHVRFVHLVPPDTSSLESSFA